MLFAQKTPLGHMAAIVGAGVQPYYYDTNARKTFMALGEDVNEKFDGCYSDFGGRPEGLETAEHCAARELKEELGLENELDHIDRRLSECFCAKVAKQSGSSYHLYLLNLREHTPPGCGCMVCSFRPNSEKRSVTWFEDTEVYKAVYENRGKIVRTDRTFQLRPCYISCVKLLPGYQNYLSKQPQ